MMKQRNRAFLHTAGTLLLSMTVLLFSIFRAFPVCTASAEETSPEGSGTQERGYRYAVTIEFGPMTFYYDYGSWNAGEMRYVSDAASTHPSADTPNGYPGWYGFDGVANEISIKYTNGNPDDEVAGLRQSVPVSIAYRPLTAAEGTVVDGIRMSLYSESELKNEISTSFRVPHTSPDTKEKTSVYVSLGGMPTVGGTRFGSETFTPVGMLTIQIGSGD